MNTTHKAYRDGLAEDLYSERKATQEKTRRIKANPDFLDSHKEEAIKKTQEELYSKLDYVRSTPEYKAAKAMKQELVAKKKDVKKQEEVLAEQKKLLADKEAELATMSEEYGEKSEKKESKEAAKKSLEFEEDTFKIDSTGWKEEERKVYRQGETVKVKVNETGDVVEYLDGPAKGEQIFITYDAFIREVMKAKNCTQEEAEAKYLMTREEFKQKMADKPDDSRQYKKFFDKEVKGHLAGYWDPHDDGFYNIGDGSSVWLAGGYTAYFYKDGWIRGSTSRYVGFSGRLLKN